MVRTRLDVDRLTAIFDATELSVKSRVQYVRKLRGIITIMSGDGIDNTDVDGTDITPYLLDAAGTIARLDVSLADMSAATRHSYANAALAAFKYVPELDVKTHPRAGVATGVWKTYLDGIHGGIMKAYLSGVPNERQSDGYVSIDDMIEKHDTLPKGSIERLLLGMYVLIPTRRCDFATTRIYPSVTSVPTTESDNYIVLPRTARPAPELVMQAYKTAKRYKVVRQDLPVALVDDIRASLAVQPRDFLFVSTRYHKPYTSEATFGKWANATLLRIFGRPLTLTLIRHAFVTNMSFDDMSAQEREDIGRQMGHARSTQDLYKFRFADGSAHSKVKPCPCKCKCSCATSTSSR